MQSNVARALEWVPRTAHDAVSCECGQPMSFGTDDLGRTTESCPTGRCFTGKRLVEPQRDVFAKPRNTRHGVGRPKKRRA